MINLFNCDIDIIRDNFQGFNGYKNGKKNREKGYILGHPG